MKDQFATHEISLKLKELSFDLQCFAHYRDNETIVACNQGISGFSYSEIGNKEIVLAPLWQQAIEWIKREHNICITQTPSIIIDSWIVVDSDSKCVGSFTKEQAILKALTLIK